MVSNKNRKTRYVDVGLTEEAAKEFESCIKGESKSEAMLRIARYYKSKCLDQEDPGVIKAD